MSIVIIPAETRHAEAIARDMRAADRAECLAVASDVEWVVRASIERSSWAYVALVEGEPMVVFGVRDVGSCLAPKGMPWCLTTDRVERHKTFFARASLAWVKKMREEFPHLESFVDARHEVACRWLKFLGFRLGEPYAGGQRGEPFRKFSWRAP